MLDELAIRDEETLSPDEQDYLGALACSWKRTMPSITEWILPELSAAELIKFLMDQQGLSFNDLVKVLGGKAAASSVPRSTRTPSRAPCFALGEHFGVEPGLFLSGRARAEEVSSAAYRYDVCLFPIGFKITAPNGGRFSVSDRGHR